MRVKGCVFMFTSDVYVSALMMPFRSLMENVG